MSVVTEREPCFCGRPWPHANDDPGPSVCMACGREWTRTRGSEGSSFTLRCEHEQDETCWHPGEVCEYWYSPFAHTTCALGRKRKARPALCPECGGQYSDLPGHMHHAHGGEKATSTQQRNGTSEPREPNIIARRLRTTALTATGLSGLLNEAADALDGLPGAYSAQVIPDQRHPWIGDATRCLVCTPDARFSHQEEEKK